MSDLHALVDEGRWGPRERGYCDTKMRVMASIT